jgi:PAS domain S-box-containing protein
MNIDESLSAGRRSIVIAEDDDATRMMLIRLLEKQRYEVRAFDNGKSAYESIAGRHPDLIILDLHMPQLDGRETIKALKADRVTKNIPVIMLTSESQIEEKTLLFETGAQDYLTKPCDPRELIARIGSHIHWHIENDGSQRSRQLADAVTPMIWTVDPAGRITFSNAATHAYTGVSHDHFERSRMPLILHPDDLVTADDAWVRALEADTPIDLQMRFKRKSDGEFRWHAVRISPPRNRRSHDAEWIYSSTEVHDTRIAEGTRIMLDAVRQMLIVCDEDGFVEYVNARWTECTGLRLRASRGLQWIDAVHPKDKIAALRHVRTPSARRNEDECELRFADGRGSYRRFLARIAPLEDKITNLRYLLTLTDIEEAKRSTDLLAEAYRQQKSIADGLKKAFVPYPVPLIPGVRISTMYMPVNQDVLVGGDWFDILPLPDGRVFFCVGDVAGHGIDAALVMVRARQSILTLAVLENDPATLLQRVNTGLNLQEPKIVTALCGYADPGACTLTFAVAGHPPPLIARSDHQVEIFPCSAIGMGVWPTLETSTHALKGLYGATFIVYTDGLTEYGHDVILGEQRLLQAARSAIAANAPDIAASICKQILPNVAADDDTTIISISFE